jgi:hypothetical protein
LERIGVKEVDFLKMDIEGSEHSAVLQSPSTVLRRFRRIAIEYHQTGEKKLLFDHFLAAGFALKRDRMLGTNYGVAEFDFRQ